VDFKPANFLVSFGSGAGFLQTKKKYRSQRDTFFLSEKQPSAKKKKKKKKKRSSPDMECFLARKQAFSRKKIAFAGIEAFFCPENKRSPKKKVFAGFEAFSYRIWNVSGYRSQGGGKIFPGGQLPPYFLRLCPLARHLTLYLYI